MQYKIKRGLELEVPGAPEQVIGEPKLVTSVGLVGDDYPGLSPSVLVRQGERVRLGQPVVRDRTGFLLTAPGTGAVRELMHGPRHSLAALVIELDDPAEAHASIGAPGSTEGAPALEALVSSGLWAALRARPFGHVADPATRPRSIFVTAVDSAPLAASPEVVLAGSAEEFEHGTRVLAGLTDGPVHVCQAPGAAIPIAEHPRVRAQAFAGPHPAGLPGTHIHLLDPVDRERLVWHVGYQDVVAIGRLFRSGELAVERVLALGGPRVERPRLLRARLGAGIEELTAGELSAGETRVLSGTVLSGRQATSWGRHLGRYHLAVCALVEPRSGAPRSSTLSRWMRGLLGAAPRAATTELHGRPEALVPSPRVERVAPPDLQTTPLLRALLVGDLETAERLGCLELEEEDLALCTYACPSKIEYGVYLRAMLDRMREAS